jgi:hypothetical protein
MAGLSINRLVNVTINLAPLAAQRRSFGTLMVAGDSAVINGLERYRSYTNIEAVAGDFGLTAPEYYAAALYFSQTPRPLTLMIGRWLRTATAGLINGGILTTAQTSMVLWTAITTGSFVVSVDGVVKTLTLLDFSAQTTLNGVATVITTALAASATCTWDGSRFKITSATTGVLSAVSFATAAGSGVDISTMLKLTSTLASPLVPGYAAETPVACALALIDKSSAWYGLQFAAATMPTDDQAIDVSALIESASPSRIFGTTITSTTVLDSTVTNDLASRLKTLLYKRSFVQYSANAYAIASFFGRAFSVNFAANRSTITLMYKLEPGIVAETLTETQASTLKAKRCNVFVNYNNDTAILQDGVMSGLAYFDEMHGLDWFQDAVQNSCYNLLYQSATKIPQTEDGVNQIINTIASVCNESVNNGLVAGGVWNADGFGQLSRGQSLKTGYYIYSLPIDLQPQADREARKAPPIQVALKLAGAIHTIDVLVNVNR